MELIQLSLHFVHKITIITNFLAFFSFFCFFLKFFPPGSESFGNMRIRIHGPDLKIASYVQACRTEMSYVMETLRGLQEDLVNIKPLIAKVPFLFFLRHSASKFFFISWLPVSGTHSLVHKLIVMIDKKSTLFLSLS